MSEYNDYAINFLIKSTIPKGKKDAIHDAIRRAHRDVLTGRFHLPEYCKSKNDKGENNVVNKLHEIITEQLNNKITLTSNMLIEELDKEFNGRVEFGAIQKLVNMTLKYILIYNLFEYVTPVVDIDEKKCDCPLDSIILGQLGEKNTLWTSIDQKKYAEIQQTIQKRLEEDGHSEYGNIFFDFKNWR